MNHGEIANKIIGFLIGFCFVMMVFLLMALLTGCTPKITEGKIIEMEFKEANQTIHFESQVVMVGKNTTIKTVTVRTEYPDRWAITIASFTNDGEQLTETFYISEGKYNRLGIGKWYTYDEEEDSLFEPRRQFRY